MATFTGALHRLLQGYWSLKESIVDTIAPSPAGKLDADLTAMFAQNKATYDLLWMLVDGTYWNQTTADKKTKYSLKINSAQAPCLLHTSVRAGELPDTADPVTLPSDVELAHILTMDEEELFQCHHKAYLHGDVQYYFQMDEQERRADFERIFGPAVKASSASLVLTQEDQIVGYIMLFTQRCFSGVMSLAVHPDNRRRGSGKY